MESDPTAPENEFVFINPVLRSPHGMVEAEEGCLSLPGLYGDVRRPERVVLNAFNLSGEEVTMPLDGLFARAVQHEVDHLDGILFIDRLTSTGLLDAKPTLVEFEEQFQRSARAGRDSRRGRDRRPAGGIGAIENLNRTARKALQGRQRCYD